MFSRKTKIIIIGTFLLLTMAGVAIYFSQAFPPDSPERIRFVMQMTEMAKPTVIRHTDVVAAPTIVVYPKPNLAVGDKILKDLKCPLEDGIGRYCVEIRDQGQAKAQGCFAIYPVDPLLGGLQPSYPLVACGPTDSRYVYQSGCMLNAGTAYIIERNGQYERIDSLYKLQSTFAPIESADEALSYAIAATGYFAFYGANLWPDTQALVQKIENTHVEVRGSEYVVRLYDHNICTCAHHATAALDVAVDYFGNIREVYREVVAQDIALVCGD